MNVEKLQKTLAPFRMLCSRNALAAHYKSLELTAELVRGCSSYGILEATVALELSPGAKCYVDAHTFLSVLGSLPDKAVLKLELENNTLLWSAGAAKGKLATVDGSKMPGIPEADPAQFYTVEASFMTALQCGTLSCSDQSLATIGMYGVVIDNQGYPAICTSDNTTASFCPFGGEQPEPAFPDKCTLAPDAVGLLNSIIRKGGSIFFTEEGLYYGDDYYVFYTRLAQPLKHDIIGIVEKYAGGETMIPIPPDSIKAFIKRASALAEAKRNTFVSMGAAEGHLYLNFAEGAAQADEYYLVDNQHVPDMPEVSLDAAKLARALERATHLVMDFMEQSVIVLCNPDTNFFYIVSGRAPS